MHVERRCTLEFDTQQLLDRGTRSSNSRVEQLGLTSDDNASLTSELEISSNSTSVDLADELARGVVHPDTITSASVDTALGVSVHTIRDERWDISEGLTVFPSTILGNIKGVDGRRRREVAAVEAKRDTGVGHVGLVAIGRDGDAVGKGEVVSNDGDGARLKVVAIDLIPKTGNGTEVLEVTVESVGKVEISILGTDNQVVQRIELTAEVVVDES